ncbi:MAG: hypothetical protein IPH78_15365 [Bacteroidetes bacterium]|nr:hypothetical protein [Bacteroidota bacterium]
MNVVAEQQATTDTFATAEQLRHFDSGINTNLQPMPITWDKPMAPV